MNDSKTRKLPLSGVRALELAEIWAGPFCGMLLGDLGAEVIKVESIQRIARGAIRPRLDAAGYPEDGPGDRPWNRFANFNALNRNKLGVTLDLTSPRGVETFKDLVAVSDVVFTNYAYGVMERLGIGEEALRKVKPDIIFLSTPGYGGTGPYRDYRSMGMAIDAITGHSYLRGYPDLDLSSISLVHHPDAVGGVTAVFAICAALLYRARTGKGQTIDLSQAEAFMPHMGEIFLEYGMIGHDRERRGNRHPGMAPHGCYPCLGKDGASPGSEERWVTIAVRDEREWREFCDVIGLPHLTNDARFSSLEARLRNQDVLDNLVSEWTSARDRYEVTRLMQERGIPAGPVLDCSPDTYDDPHLQARGYFQEVTHPDAGIYPLSGPIWKLASQSGPRHEPAPCLGQHNNYVLGHILGYSEAALREMEEEKVIGTAPLEGADMGGVRRAGRVQG